MMRTRLRTPGGGLTIDLPEDATIANLLAVITERTSIVHFDIKYGYPPKPLLFEQSQRFRPLKDLGINLNGEQLTISPKGDTSSSQVHTTSKDLSEVDRKVPVGQTKSQHPFFFGGIVSGTAPKEKSSGPVSLQKKSMAGEVPEIPMPERGSTLVLRVMPDDNSCLFRAFGTAVLPGDDRSMPELRSLVAQTIQNESDVYTKVVLDQDPDQYCRWIQTEDAWGGAIEMGILSKHFDIEICSIDVQSLRVDRFNEGRPTRCILVYSGIHYDTIVQSPSEPPHTKADNPPDFDQRVWNSYDDEILAKARELCQKLQGMHYFTDTGNMAIKCKTCGIVIYGEAQASQHAEQNKHFDMAEVKS